MDSYTTASKDFPKCGTCIYWSGEKEVFQDIIHYNMYSKGKCCNSASPCYGQEVTGDNYCFNKKDY